MDSALTVVVFLICIAVVFDFLNGLHDAANSIATIVSTRVLRPQYAVGWAAFFNFIAFLFFGLHVAQTVGTGIVTPDVIDDHVIFGALMGAIVWNVITWLAGIPSSSSHALIGGLAAASPLVAQTLPERTPIAGAWGPNDNVSDSVVVGDTAYVTGEFTHARPPGEAVGSPLSVEAKKTGPGTWEASVAQLKPWAPQ